MKGFTFKASSAAMTLVELLVVIVIIVVLAGLLVPARSGRQRSTAISCMNRLRNADVAFERWAADHEGQYPMQVPTNRGGTLELATTGSAAAHFKALSPYSLPYNKPTELVCPADKTRTQAAQRNPGSISDQTVSYFVGLDAVPSATNTFLSGDRHLAVEGTPVKPGLLWLAKHSVIGWTKELHPGRGNILFPDGHVEYTSTNMPSLVQRQDLATFRLAIP